MAIRVCKAVNDASAIPYWLALGVATSLISTIAWEVWGQQILQYLGIRPA